MKLFTLLLLLCHTLAQLLDEKKCVIDNRSEENKWEQKLIDDIRQCNTNTFEPPVLNGTEKLGVHTHFIMKSFKFDSELQEFSTFMWTFFTWQDNRLKWDPTKYNDIKSARVATLLDIWSPGIRLINSVGGDLDQRYFYLTCVLINVGIVNCIARLPYEAKCSTDLRDWPYDAQYCNLEFGFYSEFAPKMQLKVAPRAIIMVGAEYGAEWDIMDYDQIVNETSETQLIMKFKLERHAEVLAVIVIYPSLILTILTFSSLFVDARLNLRLLVICFSLLSHNYFITDLSFEIPENTKDPPRLLMYYRGSFVLTSILMVLSFVLNTICKRDTPCPGTINAINDFVFLKFVKFLIWPRWDSKTKDDASFNNFEKNWTDFANFVNTICIFITIIVYISLYCVFMPHPIPYK